MTTPFRISRSDSGVQTVASGTNEEFRYYLDRLLKMIPGEVVGLYLVGSGIIPTDEGIVQVIWTVVCLIGVVLIRAYGTADPTNNQPSQWGPVLIASVAFIIWVYTLGGPFATFNLHVPYIGSLLILAWTFFVPFFYKGPPDS
jgi:hypothetical protein